MPDASVPYYLKPKATKLAAGPDDSLEPPVAPTDAERRGIPPIFWAAMDKSKGGTAPQDAPLAPPAMDPAKRTAAALIWPRVLPEAVPNRPLQELVSPIPDLDPDIALWPVTIVSRWPFAGPPSVGIWPKGWMGVDNTATVWVCLVAGEPGTWSPLAGGGSGAFPTFTGSGSPQGVQTATVIGQTYQDTVRGGIWVAGATGNNHWAQVGGRDPASGTLIAGVFVDAPSNAGAWLITDASAGAHLSDVAGFAGTGNGVEWSAGASDGSQSFSVQVGSTGQFTLVFSQLGVFHVPAALVLDNIPTSDPAVTDEVWNDNGVLVMSGSTIPIGDTGWVNLTLVNSWTAAGNARYRKLNGIVYLEMNVGGGGAATVATLPAGFRPGFQVGMAAVFENAPSTFLAGSLFVTAAGDINVSNFDGSTPSSVISVGYSFLADA
jgi:hypothetical protein